MTTIVGEVCVRDLDRQKERPRVLKGREGYEEDLYDLYLEGQLHGLFAEYGQVV